MIKPATAVVGGGAAGFFAAITCAEVSRERAVVLLEKGPQYLSKVRISGGGRCNVTHACFDARELSRHYPRGGNALVGPFGRMQPRDTIKWFEKRGVRLKAEPDGRMFPVTDDSRTIVQCLLRSAEAAGVELQNNCAVESVSRSPSGFQLHLTGGRSLACDRLMLATGGCRSGSGGQLATALGHSLVPPVPSLFAFLVAEPWLPSVAGVSLPQVEAWVPTMRLRQTGPMVITHEGLSGPAILKLSAWGARLMHEANYQFAVRINWLPDLNEQQIIRWVNERRQSQPARLIVNTPIQPIPARLWEQLVTTAGVSRGTRWAELSRSAQHILSQKLLGTSFAVVGKSLNKEEFVTCGGVPLNEVNFKTMESRVCPNLFLGGELLDIDAVTGGFNFQAAWTTGWIAGMAMANQS